MSIGKSGQRLVGAAIVALMAYFIRDQWQRALHDGYFMGKHSMILPGFFIIGLGLLLFPIDREALREEYGVEKIQNWQQAPLPWKIVTVVAILAGIVNYSLLKGDLTL